MKASILLFLVFLLALVLGLFIYTRQGPEPVKVETTTSSGPVVNSPAQSMPYTGAGPLQTSGPLQPAQPIPHAAPFPEMKDTAGFPMNTGPNRWGWPQEWGWADMTEWKKSLIQWMETNPSPEAIAMVVNSLPPRRDPPREVPPFTPPGSYPPVFFPNPHGSSNQSPN